MNLLLFVITFLMLLTIATYARLENFRTTVVAEKQFDAAIEKKANEYINKVATENYDNDTINKGGKGGSDRSPSIRQLPIALLFQEPKEGYEGRKQLFKQLLYISYAPYPPFAEALRANPSLFDEIVERVIAGGRLQGKEVDLKRIALEDQELNLLYNRMLLGDTVGSLYPPLETLAESHEEGKKVRVYLASPSLLLTLFNDPATVSEIIAVRDRLYDEVSKGPLKNNEATAQFQEQFAGKIPSETESTLLDFTVSGTKPDKE